MKQTEGEMRLKQEAARWNYTAALKVRIPGSNRST